jgi:NAD(P)-dependent dehydrogenase (short-subunit alcohol dehydrogenase family)
VWTPLQVVAKPEEEVAEHGSKSPFGRPGQPEEIAPAYVFLASEADSSYITGELLPVIGGMPYGS